MGTLLWVTCHECGEVSEQTDGPLRMGLQPRCDRCGRIRFVPHEKLEDGAPEGFDVYGTWETDPGRVAERLAWITSVAGRCRCGGRFREEAPVRCTSCRSTNVDAESVGLAD